MHSLSEPQAIIDWHLTNWYVTHATFFGSIYVHLFADNQILNTDEVYNFYFAKIVGKEWKYVYENE